MVVRLYVFTYILSRMKPQSSLSHKNSARDDMFTYKKSYSRSVVPIQCLIDQLFYKCNNI